VGRNRNGGPATILAGHDGGVSESPAFRTDLYRGTAPYYDEFRLPYPAALVEDLCRRASVRGGGRLLDLACGPGTVTFALADRFDEVVAVDLEDEAIEFAERKAATLGVGNVTWVAGRAEEVETDGAFDLVTIGTAFHRLDRRRVAEKAMRWLRPGGHLALLWSTTPLHEGAEWQRTLRDLVVDWLDRLGATDRVPADLDRHRSEHPHQVVLQDAGFDILGRYEFAGTHEWTADAVIGFVYSTSMLSRAVLGSEVDEFERDVRARLGTEPLREDATFAYDLARRP
jgi:ubiquinone/menaquinone biosynthesis C-methylase UbiE